MGILLSVVSKLRGKKLSTKEKLDHIEEEIERIQNLLKWNRQQQRSAVFFLVAASISLFVIFAGIFYLFYMPTNWVERILYFVPFLLFPILFITLKKVLHFIFVTKITKNTQQLNNLKSEKKKILENVIDTETYKVAKEILKKFDPNRKLVEIDDKITPNKAGSPQGQDTDLRRRNVGSSVVPQQQQQFAVRQMTPRPQNPGQMMGTPRMVMNVQQGSFQAPRMAGNNHPYGTPQFRGPVPMQRTPAPILPRDRSFVDKVAEYFVGDGPSNRYALICKQCAGHNGMALAEEFVFVSYKCCYCGTFNPARKQRMNAPKLEKPVLSRESSTSPEKEEGKEVEKEKENEETEKGDEDEDDKIGEDDQANEAKPDEETNATRSEKENED